MRVKDNVPICNVYLRIFLFFSLGLEIHKNFQIFLKIMSSEDIFDRILQSKYIKLPKASDQFRAYDRKRIYIRFLSFIFLITLEGWVVLILQNIKSIPLIIFLIVGSLFLSALLTSFTLNQITSHIFHHSLRKNLKPSPQEVDKFKKGIRPIFLWMIFLIPLDLISSGNLSYFNAGFWLIIFLGSLSAELFEGDSSWKAFTKVGSLLLTIFSTILRLSSFELFGINFEGVTLFGLFLGPILYFGSDYFD